MVNSPSLFEGESGDKVASCSHFIAMCLHKMHTVCKYTWSWMNQHSPNGHQFAWAVLGLFLSTNLSTQSLTTGQLSLTWALAWDRSLLPIQTSLNSLMAACRSSVDVRASSGPKTSLRHSRAVFQFLEKKSPNEEDHCSFACNLLFTCSKSI